MMGQHNELPGPEFRVLVGVHWPRIQFSTYVNSGRTLEHGRRFYTSAHWRRWWPPADSGKWGAVLGRLAFVSQIGVSVLNRYSAMPLLVLLGIGAARPVQ
eukprot:gene11819-biopygen219